MTLNRLLKPLLNFVFSPDKEGSMSHLGSVNESLCSGWFYLHKDLLEHYANIAIPSWAYSTYSLRLCTLNYHVVLLGF